MRQAFAMRGSIVTVWSVVSAATWGCRDTADSASTSAAATADATTQGTTHEVTAGDDGTDAAGTDAVGGDTLSADGTPAPHGTNAPCGTGDDCDSGWCVPSAIGTVCATICDAGCPDGYRCMPAASDTTDPVYVCVATTTSPIGGHDGGGTVSADAADGTLGADATSDGGGTTGTTGTSPSDTASGGTSADAADSGPIADASDDATTTPTDTDGDGIPDDVDHLPCLAIRLVVYNSGVTSASLTLNGGEVVAANAFPTSEPITQYLNVVAGENQIDVGGQLTGSPGDSLTLIVEDTNGHVYFETVIVREPGAPKPHTFRFNVDAHCD